MCVSCDKTRIGRAASDVLVQWCRSCWYLPCARVTEDHRRGACEPRALDCLARRAREFFRAPVRLHSGRGKRGTPGRWQRLTSACQRSGAYWLPSAADAHRARHTDDLLSKHQRRPHSRPHSRPNSTQRPGRRQLRRRRAQACTCCSAVLDPHSLPPPNWPALQRVARPLTRRPGAAATAVPRPRAFVRGSRERRSSRHAAQASS